MRHQPFDEDAVKREYESYFDRVFERSFMLTALVAIVLLRLFVGVRHRLERGRGVVDVEPGPPVR